LIIYNNSKTQKDNIIFLSFRVIIYYQVEDNIVLISIYSKTQKDNISDEDIEDILKNYLKK
jgi:hypothetical protein